MIGCVEILIVMGIIADNCFQLSVCVDMLCCADVLC